MTKTTIQCVITVNANQRVTTFQANQRVITTTANQNIIAIRAYNTDRQVCRSITRIIDRYRDALRRAVYTLNRDCIVNGRYIARNAEVGIKRVRPRAIRRNRSESQTRPQPSPPQRTLSHRHPHPIYSADLTPSECLE